MCDETHTGIDDLQTEIQGHKYHACTLEEQIERLKESHKRELSGINDEIDALQGSIQVKDHFILELEKQNDDLQTNLEKAGFEAFIEFKNEVFGEQQKMQDLKKNHSALHDTL